jgi:hypothetical protein
MHRSASVDRRKVATRSGAGAKKSRHQICADGGNQEHEEKLVQKQHGADTYKNCNNDANRGL